MWTFLRDSIRCQYLDLELLSRLRSRYFECDDIEMERLSDLSRSLDLLFLRCLLLCLFGDLLLDLDRPIFYAYYF